MTVDVEPVFLDTNILVYASIDTSPFHSTAQQTLKQLANDETPIWINRQVLREYLATLIRPQFNLPILDVVNAVRFFESQYLLAEDNGVVTAQLLILLQEARTHHVHDTNIVATMLSYGISRILTNNPQDFMPFKDRIVVIPLV